MMETVHGKLDSRINFKNRKFILFLDNANMSTGKFTEAFTLSDKTMSDKIFVGQNFSLDKIFVTIGKFCHFLSDEKFYPTKNFVHFLFSLFRLNINWSLYTA